MLRIALMGDLHYPVIDEGNKELHEAGKKFFHAYLHRFFNQPADLYISIGDVTHQGSADEFTEVYQTIRSKQAHFRQVLGNHDVLIYSKDQLVSMIGQPRYEAIETEEALLVLLDTTKEFELHGWGLDAEQWNWLDQLMDTAAHKPMLIFAHHPVPSTTSSSPTEATALEQPFRDIRSILKNRRGTGLFFSGHTHIHSIVQQEQWHFIETTAPLCHPCFRTIEVDTDQVRVTTISFHDDEILRHAHIVHDQLEGFHRPNAPYGEGADLHCAVRISIP